MMNRVNMYDTQFNNLYRIGNVGEYSRNMAKSAISSNENTSWSDIAKNISSLGTNTDAYEDFYQNTIDKTTRNTLSFASDSAKNLNHLKSVAHSLSLASSNLGGRALVSSNEDVLISTGTSYSSSNAEYDIEVSSLAQSQVTQTKASTSDAFTDIDEGTYSFHIHTNKDSYQIDFNVTEEDTNKDVLDNMAQSINQSKADVTASVVTEDGDSYLKITSLHTGEENAFDIAAFSADSSNALDKLSIDTTQEASNAQYAINNQQFSSASNTIHMPDGRAGEITFKDIGAAHVNREIDTSKVIAAAQSFAKAYNQTVDHLASNAGGGAGTAKALHLIDGMGRADGRTVARLSAMGITLTEKGMQVNEEKLSYAIQHNTSSVQSTLGGYGGIVENVERGASEAMRIPAATYTDFSNIKIENPLIDALLPRQSGILFDLYR